MQFDVSSVTLAACCSFCLHSLACMHAALRPQAGTRIHAVMQFLVCTSCTMQQCANDGYGIDLIWSEPILVKDPSGECWHVSTLRRPAWHLLLLCWPWMLLSVGNVEFHSRVERFETPPQSPAFFTPRSQVLSNLTRSMQQKLQSADTPSSVRASRIRQVGLRPPASACDSRSVLTCQYDFVCRVCAGAAGGATSAALAVDRRERLDEEEPVGRLPGWGKSVKMGNWAVEWFLVLFRFYSFALPLGQGWVLLSPKMQFLVTLGTAFGLIGSLVKKGSLVVLRDPPVFTKRWTRCSHPCNKWLLATGLCSGRLCVPGMWVCFQGFGLSGYTQLAFLKAWG